jgi:hypothetical protein
MRITIVKITSKLSPESLRQITNKIRQERTKRQWLKILVLVSLVVGLVALAVVTGSMLLKRAPYEYTEQQMSVQYLTKKTAIGDQKLLVDFNEENPSISPDGGTAFAYYTPSGQLANEEDPNATQQLSAVLVTNSKNEYLRNLSLFTQEECAQKNVQVRGAEYVDIDCGNAADGQFFIYGYFANNNGIIFITSMSKDVLAQMMRSY